MTVVDADTIAKSFGRVRVLRGLTLRVDGGDTVALFGPNGAGKSTLLRLCATLYAPTAARSSSRPMISSAAVRSPRAR